MKDTALEALSPLDGRYAKKLVPLAQIFCEKSLIENRSKLELLWLLELASIPALKIKLTVAEKKKILNLINNLPKDFATDVKAIEKQTNHDLKAVEIYLQKQLTKIKLTKLIPYLHFGLTSWDINNLANINMLSKANKDVLIPSLNNLQKQLNNLANANAKVAMLGFTHGQAASPTTLGKEFRVYEQRLTKAHSYLKSHVFNGKVNGAVGNYNALVAAYPKVNWINVSKKFIKGLKYDVNLHTTQIEPYDCIISFFNRLALINHILLDLAKDMSTYISFDYLKQASNKKEVGSSTMPHKTNPIDFENAEGNLQMANAIIGGFANTLQESRLQRDLSNSTIIRNFGVAYGHSYLAYTSLLKGLSKISANKEKIAIDLDNNWQVLAEAIQTILRRNGDKDAYEKVKLITKNKPSMNKVQYQEMVRKIIKDKKVQQELLTLTPEKYIGLAVELAKKKS